MFVEPKPENEKSIFEKCGTIVMDKYLPTVEDKIKVIKKSGYTLENFKGDPQFDQELIEVYEKI